MTGSGFQGRDVISILDFTREDLEYLFSQAAKMEPYVKAHLDSLRGKVVACLFFEPSTRTRMSFQDAVLRLGGQVIGFDDPQISSIAKGETLADTMRMVDSYADLIVIRHRIEGAGRFAAEIAEVPVVNAGDGAQHHPTQAMLDLYTLMRNFRKIDGLNVGVMGDLKHGRASSSLIYGLSMFNVEITLIAPPELRPRRELLDHLAKSKVRFTEVSDVAKVIPKLDVLYVTRIQKERFADAAEYGRLKGTYVVDSTLIRGCKSTFAIMHPLPKIDEISPEMDMSPHAIYFKEASNGVPVRMALLQSILGGNKSSEKG